MVIVIDSQISFDESCSSLLGKNNGVFFRP